jgi:hypothetical protein
MSTLSTLRRRARRSACQRAAAVALAAILFVFGGSQPASAIDWDDAGNSASKLWDDNGNWNPDGDPDGLAVNIGNLANAANDRTLVDRAYSIDSLTITGGADVVNSTDDGATNDWELIVNGPMSVSGAGSSIVIYGGDPDGLDTDTLTIGSGGSVFVNSTSASGLAVVEVDSGLFDIQTGGTLSGTGRIDLDDLPAAATTLLLNNGTITANTTPPFVFATPAAGTLQITASSPNARFDWDGAGAGVLNVNGNQTLDIDVPIGSGGITDPFSGTMNLATGSTLDVAGSWSLGGGTINVNTAAFGLILGGGDPNPGAAASIVGGSWSLGSGTVNVDDTWDSLQFDSALTATGGTINNEGTLIFDAVTNIGVGTDFNMIGGGASLVVNALVNIDTPDFNIDGTGSATNVTTINAGGVLDLDLGVGADTGFDGVINLNGGELDVTTDSNTWALTGGSLNAIGLAVSTVNGEALTIANTLNVAAAATLNVNAATTFTSSADVVLAGGGALNMATTTYNGGSYTGGGIFRKGNATIAANTTWGTGTVDIDDGATTVQNGASLIVATDSIDDAGDGIDSNITVENTGTLTIGLNGGGDVVFDGVAGRLVYNGDATENQFVQEPASGSALRFSANSEFDVNGSGSINARLKLSGGALDINTLGGSLRLRGGDLVDGNTNEIAGGTVNGPGTLVIDSGDALRGFGTINAPVNGETTAQLIAEGGTLTVNGAILDMDILGTSGAAAVLDVPAAWNNGVVGRVELDGGQLTGGTVTNSSLGGIQGRGTVAARVVNNTVILSDTADTLVMDNSLNDWDGAGNAGTLRATNGVLELRDNAGFTFNGTVQANGGTVFSNGFGFDFEPGSTLNLSSGRYRSTANNLIGGTVNVVAGLASALEVAGNAVFESTSSTTLAADLRLANSNTIVQAGATFGGAGKLVNLPGALLTPANSANLGVQVVNEGTLEIAGGGFGRTDMLDFQQTGTGSMTIDVAGLGLGSFDRLVTSGIAQLDGTLDVFTGVAQPLGSSIQVITATGGVLGTFDEVNSLGVALGAGLEWQAVYNPNNVNLVVGLILPGDYNNDGAVDAADYTVWADNLGTANTLPGDPTPGAVTGADYTVWVANYGAVAAASSMGMATSIPEPTGLVLLAAAAVMVSDKRRGY